MNPPSSFDWAEIRRRSEAIGAALAQGSTLSPEAERSVLKQRARDLAQRPEIGDSDGETLDVVEFDLGGECHAFPLAQVREVCRLRELTRVPGVPPFVLGIINLRGEIRTVIDLKQFFALPDSGITELNKILFLQHGAVRVGILADAIRGVSRIPTRDLQPTLPTLTDRRADYLRGITPGRLVVLDAEKIFTDPRIVVDEREESSGTDKSGKSPI